MFTFFKKQKQSETTNLTTETITLKGLDCPSCAVDLDLTLEDLPSVQSHTNYAKSEIKVSFNPSQTSLQKIKSTIAEMGYQTN